MSSDGRQTAWPSASIRSPSTVALVQRRVDRPLRSLDGQRRLRGDRVGQRLGGLLELLVRDQLLAEPDAVGLLGVDARGGEDQLLGLARSDEARQPLRAAEVRDDPVLELEQTDARTPGEDAEVARSAICSPAPSA